MRAIKRTSMRLKATQIGRPSKGCDPPDSWFGVRCPSPLRPTQWGRSALHKYIDTEGGSDPVRGHVCAWFRGGV